MGQMGQANLSFSSQAACFWNNVQKEKCINAAANATMEVKHGPHHDGWIDKPVI